MQTGSLKQLKRFRGLNNVEDPMRGTGVGTDAYESWEWQSVADNVDGTNSDGLQRREGYTQFIAASDITGSFSTFDYSRMYIIDGGILKAVNHDGTTRTLQTSLSGLPFWTEVNDVVYLSCGADKLEIHADHSVRQWGIPTPEQPGVAAVSGSLFAGVVQVVLTYTDDFGREGGACPSVEVTVGENGGVAVSNIPHLPGYSANIYCTEPDGAVFYRCAVLPVQTAYTIVYPPTGPELTTQFLDVPPATVGYVAHFGSRIYAAEYIFEIDQTVLWYSEPVGYHLFNLNTGYFIVPGEVTQLHGGSMGLVIATHNRIFLYDSDKLQQVAEYGAVPGQHADIGPDGLTYFWSKRGLCRAAPFENLTEQRVSVAPGLQAGGGIVDKNGYRKYVVIIHQGGDAYNKR